ncbi:hypothetical protein CWI48_03575, partial [Neisseria meningitidis]
VPDRIEAGAFPCAGALNRGRGGFRDAAPEKMGGGVGKLGEAGAGGVGGGGLGCNGNGAGFEGGGKPHGRVFYNISRPQEPEKT